MNQLDLEEMSSTEAAVQEINPQDFEFYSSCSNFNVYHRNRSMAFDPLNPTSSLNCHYNINDLFCGRMNIGRFEDTTAESELRKACLSFIDDVRYETKLWKCRGEPSAKMSFPIHYSTNKQLPIDHSIPKIIFSNNLQHTPKDTETASIKTLVKVKHDETQKPIQNFPKASEACGESVKPKRLVLKKQYVTADWSSVYRKQSIETSTIVSSTAQGRNMKLTDFDRKKIANEVVFHSDGAAKKAVIKGLEKKCANESTNVASRDFDESDRCVPQTSISSGYKSAWTPVRPKSKMAVSSRQDYWPTKYPMFSESTGVSWRGQSVLYNNGSEMHQRCEPFVLNPPPHQSLPHMRAGLNKYMGSSFISQLQLYQLLLPQPPPMSTQAQFGQPISAYHSVMPQMTLSNEAIATRAHHYMQSVVRLFPREAKYSVENFSTCEAYLTAQTRVNSLRTYSKQKPIVDLTSTSRIGAEKRRAVTETAVHKMPQPLTETSQVHSEVVTSASTRDTVCQFTPLDLAPFNLPFTQIKRARYDATQPSSTD